MGLIGGSRHYSGGGLGQEAGWKCPACGGENAGPIAQGCSVCGAGKPGVRVEQQPQVGQGDIATYWASYHQNATVEEAYRAGYEDGVRAVRASMQQQQNEPPRERQQLPGERATRTIVAALEYFADQVLRAGPEEITSGEWCSVEEVAQMVRGLQEQLVQQGAVHA